MRDKRDPEDPGSPDEFRKPGEKSTDRIPAPLVRDLSVGIEFCQVGEKVPKFTFPVVYLA